MSFRFHPEAERELNEAVEYYEDVESALGYVLSVEIYSAIQRAVAYPRAWPVLDGDVRRALVRRFPYGGALLRRRGHSSCHCRNESAPGAWLLERASLSAEQDHPADARTSRG